MSRVIDTFNAPKAETEFGLVGEQTLPSAPEPTFAKEPDVIPNPITEWVVGAKSAVYKCSRCKTTTYFELSVFGPIPKPNCCIGPHVAFPYQR